MEIPKEIEVQILTAERYMLLGALALVNPEAADQSWVAMYHERLNEINEQLGIGKRCGT